MVQYRSHNANRSERRLLNVLPRTSSLASPPGEGKVVVVPRGQLTNGFRPNTETFSALHPTSVSYRFRLARSPGGLGGRSRIEPRLLISSLSAGANRGSLRGAVPRAVFLFPSFSFSEKEKEVIGDDAVVKSLSVKQNPTAITPQNTPSLPLPTRVTGYRGTPYSPVP